MSAKQAIYDKLQGSVATYLRCGGDVNNRIRKDLLLCQKIFLGKYLGNLSKNVTVSCTFLVF